jgi:putative Mg2+ transporter-C (MgtC) family protein
MIEYTEIAIRLLGATVAGGLLGLNRQLHGKPVGVRTFALVSLASCLIVMALGPTADANDLNAMSRAAQGVITGIGFLGAGLIIRSPDGMHIHGLTTAACIWLTACIGIVCGVGTYRLVILALPVVFFVLVVGGMIDKQISARAERDKPAE